MQLFLDTPFLLQAVAVTQLYTVFMVISFLIFRQFFSKVQKMKELWLLIVTLTSLLATGSTMKKMVSRHDLQVNNRLTSWLGRQNVVMWQTTTLKADFFSKQTRQKTMTGKDGLTRQICSCPSLVSLNPDIAIHTISSIVIST